MKEARHKMLHIVRLHLHEMSGVGESIETGNELVVSRGLGKREEKETAYWGKVSLGMRKVFSI